MKRVTEMLVVVAIVGAPLASVSPARATNIGVHVCVGAGTATLSDGIYHPLPPPLGGPSKTVIASVNFGTCFFVAAKPVSLLPGRIATGTVTVTGNCGRAFGSGNINGSRMEYEWVGSIWLIGDGLLQPGVSLWSGVVHAPPAIGESCLNAGGPGADVFMLAGVISQPV